MARLMKCRRVGESSTNKTRLPKKVAFMEAMDSDTGFRILVKSSMRSDRFFLEMTALSPEWPGAWGRV